MHRAYSCIGNSGKECLDVKEWQVKGRERWDEIFWPCSVVGGITFIGALLVGTLNYGQIMVGWCGSWSTGRGRTTDSEPRYTDLWQQTMISWSTNHGIPINKPWYTDQQTMIYFSAIGTTLIQTSNQDLSPGTATPCTEPLIAARNKNR